MTAVASSQSTAIRSRCSCSKCNGAGFIRAWGSDDYTVSVYGDQRQVEYLLPCPECQGNLAGRAKENSRLSNIPGRFTTSYLGSFSWEIYGQDTDIQRKVVNSFIEDYKQWKDRGLGLYLFSRTKGAGKTHLACLMANELMIQYGIRCQFLHVSSLIDEIKTADRDGMESPLLRLYSTDLLILDDLGAQKGNNWLNDSLFKIFDHRLDIGGMTLITSNVEVNELADRGFDDRIVDRIYRTTMVLSLPEVCVREMRAGYEKEKLLRELDII